MTVMMNVKVLGGGCSKCETLLANAKEAIEKPVHIVPAKKENNI